MDFTEACAGKDGSYALLLDGSRLAIEKKNVFNYKKLKQPKAKTQIKINNYKTQKLELSIKASCRANWEKLKKKCPRFKCDEDMTPQEVNNNTDTPGKGTKEEAFKNTLEYGIFKAGWTCYPKNQRQLPLKTAIAKALIEMYERGNIDEYTKVSMEKVLSMLVEDVIHHDWQEQLTVSVTKIKPSFKRIQMI
eukprot:11776764-Ditylum_brightwellii.AAC.1